MLSSAASLLLAAALSATQSVPQTGSTWNKIEQSIGYLSSDGNMTGVAALIGDDGLFLAHANSVGAGTLKLKFSDMFETSVIVLATDEQTQLSLLKATVWSRGSRPILKIAKQSAQSQIPILAVTSAGPVTGEFVADGKAGMMKPSLRYVPLSEIRLESSDEQIGGAIVFDASGDIFGVLGATLVQQKSQRGASRGVAAVEKSLATDAVASALEALKAPKFGPKGVTVTYALGREIVGRVVNGFKSADHKVHHPTIGIFFKTNPTGRGVAIESIMAGSPAAIAGLMPGDEVYEVDGSPTNNSVEFAIALFKKNVGDTVVLRFGRGTARGTVEVNVVSSQSSPGL